MAKEYISFGHSFLYIKAKARIIKYPFPPAFFFRGGQAREITLNIIENHYSLYPSLYFTPLSPYMSS